MYFFELINYFPLASMGATCLTHPLDTVKVQLQTQKEIKFGFFGKFRYFVINLF